MPRPKGVRAKEPRALALTRSFAMHILSHPPSLPFDWQSIIVLERCATERREI